MKPFLPTAPVLYDFVSSSLPLLKNFIFGQVLILLLFWGPGWGCGKAMLHGMHDLSSSTSDWTHAPWSGSVASKEFPLLLFHSRENTLIFGKHGFLVSNTQLRISLANILGCPPSSWRLYQSKIKTGSYYYLCAAF